MKFTIALIMLFFATYSYADLGGCVVYKIKYVLKNGTSQTGFLPLHGYEDYGYLDNNTNTNKYCDDKEFQKLINHVFYKQEKKLVFDIYTELHLVDYGRSANQADNPNPATCAFTDSTSVIQLNLDSIKYTIFLSAKPAEWDYPEVSIQIVDLTTSWMMQKNQVINHTWLTHQPVLERPESIYFHNFERYFVINYNVNISSEDLENELDKIFEKMYEPELKWMQSKEMDKEKIFEQEQLITVAPLIHQLRQKGIILIKVQMTC